MASKAQNSAPVVTISSFRPDLVSKRIDVTVQIAGPSSEVDVPDINGATVKQLMPGPAIGHISISTELGSLSDLKATVVDALKATVAAIDEIG